MSTAAEFPKVTSSELLRRLESLTTASDLQRLAPFLRHEASWPLTPVDKDSILREHAMWLNRAACEECSTPKELDQRREQIDQELYAAVKQANPELYRERWKE
jgi:hypothetical protein